MNKVVIDALEDLVSRGEIIVPRSSARMKRMCLGLSWPTELAETNTHARLKSWNQICIRSYLISL